MGEGAEAPFSPIGGYDSGALWPAIAVEADELPAECAAAPNDIEVLCIRLTAVWPKIETRPKFFTVAGLQRFIGSSLLEHVILQRLLQAHDHYTPVKILVKGFGRRVKYGSK